jgi:excisionase family DNA binding protein
MKDIFLSLDEAKQLLKLSNRTIRQMCYEGRLPGAAKLRGKWLVHRGTLVSTFTKAGQGEVDDESAGAGHQ